MTTLSPENQTAAEKPATQGQRRKDKNTKSPDKPKRSTTGAKKRGKKAPERKQKNSASNTPAATSTPVAKPPTDNATRTTGKDLEWDTGELDLLAMELPKKAPAKTLAATSTVDFKSQSEHLVDKKINMKKRWIPLVSVACFAALLVWANYAQLDQVTRGQGKVIPANKVQIIQSLEGGLIQQIDVTQGQMVEIGQPLLRIHDAMFAASYQENAVRRNLLIGRMARLQAEANQFDDIKFPPALSSEIVWQETNLFNRRRDDYLARRLALQSRIELAREEVSIMHSGQQTQSVSRLDLVRAKQTVAMLEGQLSTMETSVFREVLEAYDRDQSEFAVLDETLKRDKDRLDRTVLRSPVRGTVNKIHIDTVGRVVNSGEDIMEIVPLDDTLLVEANIRPADVGFLRPNHKAVVKFSAYDFTLYGGMDGTVEYIGVDTITNERGDSYYPVRIRTPSNSLGEDRSGEQLTIIPGMVAEVDILTGEKTVLQYLMTPVNRAREKALRER